MSGWYHSWLAAIRIARRDAWRSKGRSLLVLAMIALPILGVSAVDVTLRSSELGVSDRMDRMLGGADARLTDTGMGGVAIEQTPHTGDQGSDQWEPVGGWDAYTNRPTPEGKTDVTKVIPAGTRALTDTRGSTPIRTTHGLLHSDIRELNAADPLAKGLLDLDRGRFPEKAGEIAATNHFLEAGGLSVGSKVKARASESEFTVVGSYDLPDDLNLDQVNALPGTFFAPLNKALTAQGLTPTGGETTYLVGGGGRDGFTWNMVKAANTKGVEVLSRAVALSPPADSEVPYFAHHAKDSGHDGTSGALAAAATIVGLALLEICLLAGPAFAVGARRSRRQLGLVGANGGDRRHIRAIVLSGGLVIGVAAAVIGTALGIALTLALQPALESYLGKRFGDFDLRPLELLGIALLAVFTGLMAAVVPAVTASRQPVLASLTGRRGVRRANRVLPLIGLIAVALGAAIALYGATASDSPLLVGGGSALAELGVVALTPVLVGLFGRIGGWLPLSPRLALRDAVRNRGRTAPAVAAVLAAVAGTVAVATYTASSDAQQRASYEAMLPYGVGSTTTDEAGGRDLPAMRAAVQTNLPLDVLTDVRRIVVGSKNCTEYSEDAKCGLVELVVPKANQCPLHERDGSGGDPAERFSVEERRELAKDWRCRVHFEGNAPSPSGVTIGDEKVLRVLGITDPGTVNAIKQGRTVAFGRGHAENGKIGIKVVTDRKKADEAMAAGKDAPGKITSVPVHQAPESVDTYGLQVLMPPAAAKAAGFTTVPYGLLFSTSTLPSTEQTQAMNGAFDKIGITQMPYIEAGFTGRTGIVLLALTVFAGLVTIGAAGIATGLAQADAEPDLKTLAAVGAPPRVRRTLSGFQCGTVALMGVVLGSAAGVLPAIGLLLNQRRSDAAQLQQNIDMGWGGSMHTAEIPIVVPWPTLAALLVAVPLGAALLAALVTRSRGALARRAEA
ncbi:FtsX-like permease family protein [Streptomyces sp. NPDC091272]|uniref:FtsX-like permease family protein n=1 Tax=Streptomyces sp. NPDC091272 TaxID=3365981 RepID=UPI0037FC7430